MKKAPATEVAKRQTRPKYSTAPAGGFHALADSLLTALEGAGIVPADPGSLIQRMADGQVIRFPTASKPRKKNGYLIAHFDRGLPAVAVAGDWSQDVQTVWHARNPDHLPREERDAMRARMEQARKMREQEQARRWENAATRAARVWHNAKPASPDHPYLIRKGIQPHRARQQGRELVLLLTDLTGKAWSLQTITEAGEKRLMAGGRKAGNFIAVDGPEYPARVLICEGYATGATLAEMDPAALVLAAVDAGNLQAVATGARNRWPDADLIVCGDDDRKTPGNPGATAARLAAIAAGARIALPEWPPAAPLHLSDFNDLANWERGPQ